MSVIYQLTSEDIKQNYLPATAAEPQEERHQCTNQIGGEGLEMFMFTYRDVIGIICYFLPGELGKQLPVFLFCTWLGASFYVPGLKHTGTTCIWSSFQFSSVQDGIHVPGKAHIMRSTQSLRCFPNIAFAQGLHIQPRYLLHTCLSVSLSVYLPTCLFVYLFVHLSIYLCVCLSR